LARPIFAHRFCPTRVFTVGHWTKDRVPRPPKRISQDSARDFERDLGSDARQPTRFSFCGWFHAQKRGFARSRYDSAASESMQLVSSSICDF
jgi:hypothetical protein